MPVQKFALEHPEYGYIWNWEMDSRFVGNYADLIQGSQGERNSGDWGFLSRAVDLARFVYSLC